MFKCWNCGFWVYLDDVALPGEIETVICADCYHRHGAKDALPFPLSMYRELRPLLNGIGLWFTNDQPAVST